MDACNAISRGKQVTATGQTTALKILDATRDLIARRGYSNFSYADVSAAVDIHKASIHHHFPAKANLAQAVVDHSREIFNADMAALAAGGATPLDQLRAYMAYWHRSLVEDPETFCVAGMMGAEVPFLSADAASAVGEYFGNMLDWCEKLLAAGAAAGQFRLVDTPRADASMLISLVYGALLVARGTRHPDHFKQVSDAAIARFTGG
jgi:TetR/AcrR family transcriptional repressor of nem operon